MRVVYVYIGSNKLFLHGFVGASNTPGSMESLFGNFSGNFGGRYSGSSGLFRADFGSFLVDK